LIIDFNKLLNKLKGDYYKILLMTLKKVIIGLLIILLFWTVRSLLGPKQDRKIFIAGKKLSVELATTQAQREKGLSGRESLCRGCGLLFVFDQPGIYSFWMRRMYFDIDILWLAGDEIVDITYGAKAPSAKEFDRPKIFYQGKVPIDRVLEVNAGWAEKNNIKIGDKVINRLRVDHK